MEEASSSSSSSSASAWTASPPAGPWIQIVVRGIPLSASEEELKNHFGRYGEVVTAEDVYEKPRDSDDKQAFVYFADPASAERASASREKNNHIILGKMVEVSRYSEWLQQRTIEVYNLPPGTTSSQFRIYFEKFGVVTEAVVEPGGSGYVVFKWDESLRRVLRKKSHLFYGTELKVRRQSPRSKAFLEANAARHDLAGATSSTATPYAGGVAFGPRPVYTHDSMRTATTPYYALYTPSYNRPTTAIFPHAYSAPTTPFGTPYASSFGTPYASSYDRPISATTYAYGAPSISPYGVPYMSFYNRPTTATPHAHSAPTPPFGTPYTSSYYRPIGATTYAYGARLINPYGAPSTTSYNRPISATPYANSAPSTIPYGAPYTPSYNQPMSTTPFAYGAPSTASYNRPLTATPYANGAPSATLPLNNPMISTTDQCAYTAPCTSFGDRISGAHNV